MPSHARTGLLIQLFGGKMDKPVKRVKLPFWSTVLQSYKWGFGQLGTMVARRWMVLAVLGALMCALYWLIPPYDMTAKEPMMAPSWLSIGINGLASILFTSMIAVPWHRLVLTGQPMTGNGFDLHPRILAYALWGVLFGAAVMVPMSMFGAAAPVTPGANPTDAQTTTILIAMVGMYVAIYLVTRFQLKLVATALSDPAGGLGTIWWRTRWSFWRLFGGSALAILPVMGAQYLFNVLVPPASLSPGVLAITHAIQALIGVVFTLPLLTFLSLSYQHFMTKQPEAATT
jgi:hypothetical protein